MKNTNNGAPHVTRRIAVAVAVAALGAGFLAGCGPAADDPIDTPSNEVPQAQVYMLTLTDEQIECGMNVCAEGAVVSVEVTVDADVVTAGVCYSQDIDAEDAEAVASCTDINGEPVERQLWAGTRDGDTATIVPAADGNDFTWAVISFENDAAVKFTANDNCERLDGTFGETSEEVVGCV
ncbi:MAG: hypothetical protein FWD55_08645 [Propionibacteriaceae bacterium]|nr:hypothetical protein [Propionibacteriaceae bacterium]